MVAEPIGKGDSAPAHCATCHRKRAAQSLKFVPWGESLSTGRWLCFNCLLTLFRLDTRAEMEQRRASRQHDLETSRLAG
jgi:hypothetical protein